MSFDEYEENIFIRSDHRESYFYLHDEEALNTTPSHRIKNTLKIKKKFALIS